MQLCESLCNSVGLCVTAKCCNCRHSRHGRPSWAVVVPVTELPSSTGPCRLKSIPSPRSEHVAGIDEGPADLSSSGFLLMERTPRRVSNECGRGRGERLGLAGAAGRARENNDDHEPGKRFVRMPRATCTVRAARLERKRERPSRRRRAVAFSGKGARLAGPVGSRRAGDARPLEIALPLAAVAGELGVLAVEPVARGQRAVDTVAQGLGLLTVEPVARGQCAVDTVTQGLGLLTVEPVARGQRAVDAVAQGLVPGPASTVLRARSEVRTHGRHVDRVNAQFAHGGSRVRAGCTSGAYARGRSDASAKRPGGLISRSVVAESASATMGPVFRRGCGRRTLRSGNNASPRAA
ncbi:unnamed protein product [Lampetra planeri]